MDVHQRQSVKKNRVNSLVVSQPPHSPPSRHRRAIQKSRGSKVRRAEGTMESEPGAQAAATANSAGTASTTTVAAAAATNTTAASSGSATSSSTAAPSGGGGGGGSSIAATSAGGSSTSSSTTTGRQALPQISVYSGIPDRQTVQVGVQIPLQMWLIF